MIKNMQENYERHIKQPKSAQELFEAFEKREQLPAGELLSFEGVGDKDVYNITAPFVIDGKTYIAGRVESRGTECDSQTRFFEERNDIWIPVPHTPTFDLQDPFVTKVGQELIFGGVETFPRPDTRNSGGIGYRTLFFRGKTLQTLTHFATGPDMMKDIRTLMLPNDKICVLTRPQSPWVHGCGRGKIGMTILPQFEALTAANILSAKIIEGQFRDKEWGGVDEMHFLEDGKIGVLGHVACEEFSSDNVKRKHYYAVIFTLELATNTVSPMRIIASRKNFPSGPAKRSPELDDIIFPGGLIRHRDKTATLYVGLSDTAAGRITIPDPFIL